jgi:tRNA1(Val) A37 N6-methylase TrmN6
MDEITRDTLLHGRVTLLQPARGFRSSLDPVLLSAFVTPPFGHFVDIGCGTGAVAFLLAAVDLASTGVGVEIQPRLAELAKAGRDANALGDRLAVLGADVRVAVGTPPLGRAAFDLVVSNPPFHPVDSGPPSPDAERAQANHELTLTLEEWLDAAAALVRPEGRVAVVYAAERLPVLLGTMLEKNLVPERLRLVHPHPDTAASRALVEARKGGGGPLLAEPPLVLHEPGGGYTPEVKRMLGDV